jgi:hypothetical protein
MITDQELLDGQMGTPPPSTIDVDTVIRRQRRRVRYQRSGLVVSVVAMSLAVAAILTMLPRQGGVPNRVGGVAPATSPTWTPTAKPTPTIEERLTAALANLPKELHVPTDGSAKFKKQVDLGTHYLVNWKFNDIWYFVDVSGASKPDPGQNACASGTDMSCEHVVDKDGTTLQLTYPPQGTMKTDLMVDYYAPDGTEVQVGANACPGPGPSDQPCDYAKRSVLPKSDLTFLVAAAHNPGFTLNP